MHTRHLLTRGGQWLGVVILVVATLPLLAAVAWVLRALLIVAGLAALVGGCILYGVCPGLRHWASHLAHHSDGATP